MSIETCPFQVDRAVISILLFITLTLFNVSSASKEFVCGFPGIPYGGWISYDLEEWAMQSSDFIGCSSLKYRTNDIIEYDCYKPGRKFKLEGNNRRRCSESGYWEGDLLNCVENAAFEKPVNVSSDIEASALTDGFKDPLEVATSCLPVKSGSDQFVEIHLGSPYSVKEVVVYFESDKLVNILSNDIMQINISGRKIQCYREIPATSEPASNMVRYRCKPFYTGPGVEPIVRFSHSSEMDVSVCEVEVYVHRKKDECGYPEIPANGRVSMTDRQKKVSYQCSHGYQLVGSKERRCINGQWIGRPPKCSQNIVDFSEEVMDASVEITSYEFIKDRNDTRSNVKALESTVDVLLTIVIAILSVGLTVLFVTLLAYIIHNRQQLYTLLGYHSS